MPKFLNSKKVQLIIIVTVTVLAYSNIFRNEFVIDDKTFIADWAEGRSLANVGKFFTGNVPVGHEGVYRPLRSVFYALYSPIFGQKPFGYHLSSLLVHLASTALVYLIVTELIKLIKTDFTDSVKKWFPFIVALLFGLHPIHTETITYIASGMDTIGSVFFLGAFYLYLRGKKYYWGSVSLGLAAYFMHETTLILPLVIILYEFCFNKLKVKNLVSRMYVWGPYIGGAMFYLVIRFFVLHVNARGPYLADSVYLTFLTMLKVFVRYLSLIFLPVNLANNHVISKGIEAFVYRDYRTSVIAAQSILDGDILLSILVLAALVFAGIALRKKYPILTFAIFWFFIAMLPISEIIPQGSMMNEKLLYIPSFGIILIFAYFFGRLMQTAYKNIALGALILVAAVYLTLTFSRNRDWRDEISIWSADVKQSPGDNAYAYFQLGNAYASRGAVDLAIASYKNSFNINPQFVVALGSIAKTLNDAGKGDLAIDYYRKSLEVNPYFWEAHNNLADIYVKRADFDLAAGEYKQILAIMPNFAQVSQKLLALPTLEEATNAANIDNDKVWLVYRMGGLSLKAPSNWKIVSRTNSRISFEDDKGEFNLQVSLEKRDAKESFEQYVMAQTETLGKKINEGQAFIPNFDKAIVRVWQVETTTKLEFFLFKGDEVLRVVAGPTQSPVMANFDLVLGSLKLE